MKVYMDDGPEIEIGPGDAFVIPPGHDAEVIGDEACVNLDFGHFGEYAKR
jgi:quercetin dioxygenase-like cupin family protein